MGLILTAGMVLIAGAVLSLVLHKNWLRAWSAIISQSVATALVLSVVIPVLNGGPSLTAQWTWSFPIELVRARVDALSSFFLVWSLPMILLGTVYASGYLRPYFEAGRNGGSHFALLNVTSLSFLMIYSVENAMVFLLGWEIAAVAAWLLVIWDYKNQKIRFAGFNYLVSTHIGMFFLIAAFMAMHSQTGSMDFEAFSVFLGRPGTIRDVVFVLFVTSCGLKAAFFPLHTWLPRAHSAAPAHVSALMSGVIHKAGLFAVLRFILLIRSPEEWMGWYLIGFSALSAILGVLYTSSQRDLKRLLGYSSTENVGIAGIGIGVGVLGLCWRQPALVMLGFTGGIFHILNHALFKCLLFYAAGAIYHATHTVDIERLGGLARHIPRTAAFFLIGGLAISALPPLNGFASEFLIYCALLNPAAPSGPARFYLCCVAALLAFVGGVSALSMTRAYGMAFLGLPRDSHVHVGEDAPAALSVPMFAHSGGVVLLGVVPAVGLWAVRGAAELFTALSPFPEGAALDPALHLAPAAAASAMLAALVGLLWLLARGSQRTGVRGATWGCGYQAPNVRMQYTGASFSARFAALFESVLPRLTREELPRGYFPRDGRLATHYVDAVERRVFQVIGEAEDLVTRLSSRVPDEPRWAFAGGLVALATIVWAIVSGAPF